MRDGAPIHGNTRLEVIWVTIPFLMVSALAIYGWIVLDDIEAKQPDTLIVNVTGQQFTWSFDYPSEKVKSSELVLPKDRPVEFRIHTKDVLHSFWVPEFRLKSDAVPGLTTKIRVTPDRIGHYQVVCAELCGIGHSTMRQNVRVVAKTDVRRVARRAEAGRRRRRRARPGGRRRWWRRQARRRGRVRRQRLRQLPYAGKPANATGTVGPDLGKIDNPTSAFIKQSIDGSEQGRDEGLQAEHHAPGLRRPSSRLTNSTLSWSTF